MPAIDEFADNTSGLSSPITAAEDITPNDAVDLGHVTRALYVGGEGALRVTLQGGETVTLAAVNGGALYPLRVARVWATGTTATYLVGLR